MKTILTVLTFGLCGCANLTGLVETLSRDNAAVSVQINTIYGSARVVRVNPGTNGIVTIAPDGTMTVKYE